MLYRFKDSVERYGSQYLLDKAIAEKRFFKLENGIYSDTGDETELEVLQFKYPASVLTQESAFYYHGLTDAIPEVWTFATARNAKSIPDDRIVQKYVDERVLTLGAETRDFDGEKVRIYDLPRIAIELARMKTSIPSDIYKEAVAGLRARLNGPDLEKLTGYLAHFPKRNHLESIIYNEII